MIDYKGKVFKGYNVPRKSWLPSKKRVVLAKKGKEVKLIHYGAKGYKHNYSKIAWKSYMSRSAGIRDKKGKLTKDNIFSANYWARKDLWKGSPYKGGYKY